MTAYDRLLTALAREGVCLSLKQLIAAKRAAGRPKDLDAIAELEAIEEEERESGGDAAP